MTTTTGVLQIDQQRSVGPVLGLAFDPDGGFVATAGANGSTCLWRADTGGQVDHLPGGAPVVAVAVDDRQRIAGATVDGTVRIGTTTSPDPVTIRHVGARSLAFDHRSRRLATAGVDGTARMWDGSTGDEVSRFGHEGPVTAVVFHSAGAIAATGATDGTARVWDVSSGEELHRFVHPTPVRALTFASGGTVLVTAGADGIVRVHDLHSAERLLELRHRGLLSPTWTMAFSPTGNALATAGADGFVRVWASVSHAPARSSVPAGSVRVLAWSPDETFLAAGTTDGTVQLWPLGQAASPSGGM